MKTTVKVNSLWRHKNGNHYLVLMLTNMSSTRVNEYPPTVVYRDVKSGAVWSKALSDWHRSRKLVVNNVSIKSDEN